MMKCFKPHSFESHSFELSIEFIVVAVLVIYERYPFFEELN
jgi:hypothetical protein